ncbi:hypothetical protein Hanom_Chr00s000005g01611541 [Helianthus anomalus]
MDYHVLNSTKRKKSLFINFLPNTQNRFIAISKHNNQIIRLKTQSQTPSKHINPIRICDYVDLRKKKDTFVVLILLSNTLL